MEKTTGELYSLETDSLEFWADFDKYMREYVSDPPSGDVKSDQNDNVNTIAGA